MNNVQLPVIPQYDVVTINYLDEYRDGIPEILVLARQLTAKWLVEPTDETIIGYLERAIQSSTVFLVLHSVDANSKRIVGMAILNTIHSIECISGYISQFTILNNQSIADTLSLQQLLTYRIIERARSLGMFDISYQHHRSSRDNPRCEGFRFQEISGYYHLNLVD